jgi:hypothetical protein
MCVANALTPSSWSWKGAVSDSHGAPHSHPHSTVYGRHGAQSTRDCLTVLRKHRDNLETASWEKVEGGRMGVAGHLWSGASQVLD